MEALKKYNPVFTHPNDLVAFAVHISFLQNGCKLVGLSEEQYLEDIGSVPQGWNRSSDIYTFRYVEKNANLTEDKSKTKDTNNSTNEEKQEKDKSIPSILVRVLQLEENSLIVSAVRSGSDTIPTLDLNLSDHINLDEKIKSQSTPSDKFYKDFGALTLLIEERVTHKIIPSQQSSGSEKSKDKEKEREDGDDVYNNYDREQYPFGIPRPVNDRNKSRPYGGDFGGDLNPLPGGGIVGIGGAGIGGGGLMGPRHPRFGDGDGGIRDGRPGLPNGPRFDPFGPGSLGNQPGPDPDHMRPPRQGNRRENDDPYGMFL